jgi:hypothetical protein
MVQDGFLPLEEMKSCVVVVELISYFRLRLRLDYFVCILQVSTGIR